MKTPRLIIAITICVIIFACKAPQKKINLTSKVSLVSNGVRIDYTDTGKGDTTLLFVHGWAINKTYWADQVNYFGKRYRVVTIDLPGFGKSGKNRTRWNTAAYGQDIKNVINQLGLKNVILVGHSMAGNIVLQGAVDAPEYVIALVGVDNFKSVGITTPDSAKYMKEYAEVLGALKKNFKKVAFDWFNQGLFYKTTSKPIRERILNDVAHTDSTIAIATQEWDNFDDAAALLKSKKKLFLINSDYQPTETKGLKAKNIPYELLVVHNTGHFPMVEKPQEFNQRLDQVIAELAR